jgi:hypothetical protein
MDQCSGRAPDAIRDDRDQIAKRALCGGVRSLVGATRSRSQSVRTPVRDGVDAVGGDFEQAAAVGIHGIDALPAPKPGQSGAVTRVNTILFPSGDHAASGQPTELGRSSA